MNDKTMMDVLLESTDCRLKIAAVITIFLVAYAYAIVSTYFRHKNLRESIREMETDINRGCDTCFKEGPCTGDKANAMKFKNCTGWRKRR